jgi:hypothetical protein
MRACVKAASRPRSLRSRPAGDPLAPLPVLAANGVVAGEPSLCVTIRATVNDRSVDRHLARKERTHHFASCAWCAGLIMQAADVPGRRPRFCSPRCRQFAYRARHR